MGRPVITVQRTLELDTELTWDVSRIDPVFGVGRKLGQVRAASRRLAEAVAKSAYPGRGELLVTIAGGGRSRRARKESR